MRGEPDSRACHHLSISKLIHRRSVLEEFIIAEAPPRTTCW